MAGPPIARGALHRPRHPGSATDVSPPVLNGFPTLLNTVDSKKLGGLARAFHLIMQLAGCVLPSPFRHSLWHQWERLRSYLPLTLAVTQAVANLSKHILKIPRLFLPLDKALLCKHTSLTNPQAVEVLDDEHIRTPLSSLWVATCNGGPTYVCQGSTQVPTFSPP